MRKANAFLEYALVIGAVSLALITMNVYMKRGLQGRVADMSDYFIGREHAANSEPTANITSNTNNTYLGTTTYDALRGGGTNLALLDTTQTQANSLVVDLPTFSRSENFIPAERGYVDEVERPGEEDIEEIYDADAENIKAQTKLLEARIERLRLEADALEKQAKLIDEKGRNLIYKANHMDCPRRHGGGCRQARRQLAQNGQKMVKQAKEMMQKVQDKRQEVKQLEGHLDELKQQL